jgi:hypothetical protein
VTAGGQQVEKGLRWLDAGGLLYGTIVSAVTLSVGAGRGETAAEMIAATASSLIIYWLAHVYTGTMSERGSGSTKPLHCLVRDAAVQQLGIPLGGLPVLLAEVVLSASGVTLWLTVLSGVGVAIVVLAVDGFLVGRRAGASGWKLSAEVGSACVFGGLIALLLVLLHAH